MSNNVSIYQSSIEFESRILKESASILKLGLFSNVYILGIWRKYLLRKEKVNKKEKVQALCETWLESEVRNLKNNITSISFYYAACSNLRHWQTDSGAATWCLSQQIIIIIIC